MLSMIDFHLFILLYDTVYMYVAVYYYACRVFCFKYSMIFFGFFYSCFTFISCFISDLTAGSRTHHGNKVWSIESAKSSRVSSRVFCVTQRNGSLLAFWFSSLATTHLTVIKHQNMMIVISLVVSRSSSGSNGSRNNDHHQLIFTTNINSSHFVYQILYNVSYLVTLLVT